MTKEELYTKERAEFGYIYCFRENGVPQRFVLDEIIGEGKETVYIFINMTYGNNTRMTLKRFNYKWRHHSGRKILSNDPQLKIDLDKKEPQRTAPAETRRKELMRTSEPLKLDSDKQVVIELVKRLESLTPAERNRFSSNCAVRSLSEYIDILKSGKSSNATLLVIDSIFKRANIVL